MFTGVWRPALGDLDPNPPLTPERRVEPHSEPLSLCEFWIPFWKFWSVSCLQQQKGVGEGKTLKICDVWWPLGEQNWEGFAETLPLKAPELLSYRGLRALPGCGCGEEAPAPSTQAKLDTGRGGDAVFLTRWPARPAAITEKCGVSE